jgi:hypothetical protein
MKTTRVFARAGQVFLLLAAGSVLVTGCSKSGSSTSGSTPATTPKEAASQLQQAFSTSTPEVKTAATTASQALRTADYGQAVQALDTIKAKKDLTAEQTMVVHESEAAMEMRLLQAIEAGDPKAKQAYEQLKKRRRN